MPFNLIATPVSVSYTHLDVYKRQIEAQVDARTQIVLDVELVLTLQLIDI